MSLYLNQRQGNGATRRQELKALFDMGADVGEQLAIPSPPSCLAHVLGYYREVAVMSEVDSLQVDTYCRLKGVSITPLEFDTIISLRAASNMISNGSTPKQIIEAFNYG